MITKKITKIFTILFIGLSFSLGCSKSYEKNLINDDTDTDIFSITEAKNWFLSNSDKIKINSINGTKVQAIKIKSFSVNWDKAIFGSDDKYSVVECTLHFDFYPGFNIFNKGNTPSVDKINGITRLIILKDKKNGKKQSILMHLFSTSSKIDESITYFNRDKQFSGHVFFTDLKGNFINGWIYENGKIIKASKKILLTNNIVFKSNSIRTTLANDVCSTYEISWYERDCVEYYSGNVVCGPWNYIGSTFQTYCVSDGGGGGGGGGYQPPVDPVTDPCSDAQSAANVVTSLSQNNNYINAKSIIQTSNPNIEQNVTFGKDANGNITSSIITSCNSSSSCAVNTNWPGAFSDLHNHPDLLPPSPGDIYNLIGVNNNHIGYNTRIVVTPDGTVFALDILDLAMANTFKATYPPVNIGYVPEFPSEIFDKFHDVRSAFILQGFSNLVSEERAMSYILDKFKTGISLLKQDTNGNFKRLITNENLSNGNTTYSTNNCQ